MFLPHRLVKLSIVNALHKKWKKMAALVYDMFTSYGHIKKAILAWLCRFKLENKTQLEVSVYHVKHPRRLPLALFKKKLYNKYNFTR